MTQIHRPIERLSQEVIGKIAAGEVVERPAAAIKELVENSIDAGASAVSIEIRDGGISYIRVTDNGSGIPMKDIRMAFERHATSKLRRSEELSRIETLGFRGEALASIAAVSRVTCTTRTRQDEHGLTAVNEGGVMTEIKDAACPEGTTFVIRDLFYNTPVRLKFLKKPSYEASLVSDLVMRLILANPQVSFRFINQGKTVYHSPGDGELASAVYSIYGKEMLRSMRRVKDHQGGIVLDGYVGIGESARGNRGHQSFFINGRYMKNAVLSQGLEAACKERVMIGHYPICVLHLTMPYELVDVNVHPNKLEVRFQNERLVYESVQAMVRRALDEDTPFARIPEMELTNSTPCEASNKPAIEIKKTAVIPTLVQNECPNPEIPVEQPVKVNESSAIEIQKPAQTLRESSAVPLNSLHHTVANKFTAFPMMPQVKVPVKSQQTEYGKVTQQASLATPALSSVNNAPESERTSAPEPEQTQIAEADKEEPVRIIGVAMRTFILAEYRDQLLLIDQHAVHERLLYDKMMSALDQHTATQELLVPIAIELTHREAALVGEHMEALKAVGFDLEFFGGQTLQLRGVPMILGVPQAKSSLMDILDQLDGVKTLNTLEKRRNAILQMACKKAVKGGDTLTQMEVEDLVRRMNEQGVTPTCPHGRPLVIALSHQELDKRFKRIQ